MSSKSTAQRIVEVIAIALALGCLVPVGLAVWGRYFKPPAPSWRQAMIDAYKSSTPPDSGIPAREPVDSVAKLPATYPTVADVKASRPETADEAVAGLRQTTKLRHLMAYAGNGVFLSPGARAAVVFESTPAKTVRLALWNLDTGKLIRFFSSEEGQATREYREKENADFGSKVDHAGFHWGSFSPDGKTFAAYYDNPNNTRLISLWEVSSGKLLWQRVEPAGVSLVLFPSPRFLAVGASVTMRQYAWRRIDAATGDCSLLTPVSSTMGATSPGATYDGHLAYLSENKLIRIDVATRQTRSDLAAQAPSSRHGDLRLWYSADGQQLYAYGGKQQEARIDVWDMSAHKQLRRIPLEIDEHDYLQGDAYPCPAVGLVGIRAGSGDANSFHFFDVSNGKRKFSIQTPFRHMPLKAVSADARRMLMETDQTSLLVVDFTGELPEGKLNVSALLPAGALAATR